MAQTIINIGTEANDESGDTLRGAFANTNNNFSEVFSIANTANAKATILGPYASDSAASAGGVSLNGLYYTASGNVRIRLV